MEKEKIKFSDLSTALKTELVLMWIVIGLSALGFLVGFIEGVVGVY